MALFTMLASQLGSWGGRWLGLSPPAFSPFRTRPGLLTCWWKSSLQVETKSYYRSTLVASVCIPLAMFPLAKASQVGRAGVSVRGD